MSPEQMSELTRKDREMMALLKDETKVLYDNITSNKYLVDGKFSPSLVRDDAYELVGKVVRIYQPGIEQPLLETNMGSPPTSCQLSGANFASAITIICG